MVSLLKKIEGAGLVGRGGGCFPTATKWEMVKKAKAGEKYVICNASEGEPGVKKDGYILNHQTDKVIRGIELAREFLSEKGVKVKAYIYINPEYYGQLGPKLLRKIGDKDIEIFVKPHEAGYIGGEETSILNTMEGEKTEPRLRPPFPTTNGLWGCPTIINNVETLLNVALVESGEYKKERYYTIGGKAKNKGVFCLPENWTLERILKETGNLPRFDFFTQVGGNGSGMVLNSKQLKRRAEGAGTITIYKLNGHKPQKMIKTWIDFFLSQSCGQCTPCREGVYRLKKIVDSEPVDWKLFAEILDNLEASAFCGLGCAVPIPIKSYLKNVARLKQVKFIDQKIICQCFS